MLQPNQKKLEPVLSWILAMILCPLGVCLSVKSNFGVSMIEAPVYALHLKIAEFRSWFTYGTAEYVLQAILLLAMCLVIRRFKWQYLLSFVTAFVFGQILDGWQFLFSSFSAETLFARIVVGIVGCVITSLAVAMFFRTWLPLEVWELFVKEVSERFGWNITKVKWIYDLSSLGAGILMMLLFFGKFRLEVIGIGTLITTFANAPIIGLFSKLLDKFWSKVSE